MLLDQSAQGIVPGVELREPGVLAPQLLGFVLALQNIVLDPLSVAPHQQDFVLDLLGSLFDPPRARLDLVHGTPVERRAQVARRIEQIR